ncbi:MAG TPA: heparan-alpha-glucosaminide N-acetyltransferase domain-containing protein [Paludibacteraceae bacterium]|nr:heparan-alpha-glucosaminide N-acetyltransferase domain-containing protein [Paludibacteraceae bacterium]HOL29268.1 heparan-alpha-glucosaminide N-acetyltransferase domain-containing protein [Paludibacteraceae bacterium]
MASTTGKSARLLSLDVLRGITIAGMILVNNPGNWGSVYPPLRHAEWNGLTPTDLVFPFFMFIMGVSMYLSYKKFDFKFSNRTFLKLFRRSSLLFLIGLAIGWLGLFSGGLRELQGTDIPLGERIWQAATNFENVRILGVLQRLALVSFFGTLIILLIPHKHIPWLTGAILLIYWILIGVTGSYVASENNIIAIVDRAILGASHMYTETLPDGKVIPFDPEGILSTLPCIAHVLIGFWAGKLISESKSKNEQIQNLAIFGTILFFAGFFLHYGFPVNKKIWSSSFVLVTCGLASLLFSLLIWIIDVNNKKKWSVFFESFGVNPLFIYVVADILSILLSNVVFMYQGNWISIKNFVYFEWLSSVFGNYLGSLIFALCFVFINWIIAHILYKKKIYIKL